MSALVSHRLEFRGKVQKHVRKSNSSVRMGTVTMGGAEGRFRVKIEIEYLGADDLFKLSENRQLDVTLEIEEVPAQ